MIEVLCYLLRCVTTLDITKPLELHVAILPEMHDIHILHFCYYNIMYWISLPKTWHVMRWYNHDNKYCWNLSADNWAVAIRLCFVNMPIKNSTFNKPSRQMLRTWCSRFSIIIPDRMSAYELNEVYSAWAACPLEVLVWVRLINLQTQYYNQHLYLHIGVITWSSD